MKTFGPDARESPLNWLASIDSSSREQILNAATDELTDTLAQDWATKAREEQIPPPLTIKWDIWLVLAGRGFGKTRCAAEAVNDYAYGANFRRMALVGQTSHDWASVMLHGDTGIFPCSRPDFRPKFHQAKDQERPFVEWPNGVRAYLYSGDRPDQLRGPQHDFAWFDELAKFQYPRACWDNFAFGWRIGEHPRCIITTTPKPIRLLRELVAGKHGDVRVVRGSSKDNLANLAPRYRRIIQRYEGTRLGRQEIEGDILDESPLALWKREWFERDRISWDEFDRGRFHNPPIRYPVRLVIGVDPAATSKMRSDETGIIVLALLNDNHVAVLDDLSGRYRPEEWAERVYRAYVHWNADMVVGEINNGGEMVESVMQTYCARHGVLLPFHAVHASHGKYARAEPIAVWYEKGLTHHVGNFDELEDQMCVFEPSQREREKDAPGEELAGEVSASPDRVDALVWAATELLLDPVETRTQVYYEDRRQISPF